MVISHLHAARFHGLPAPLGGWGTPVLTARTGPTRTTGTHQVLVAPLADVEVLADGWLAVTSPVRTMADCLRTLPERDGLAMLDAALRLCLLTSTDLQQAIVRCRGWPGAPRARRVAPLGNGRRESALESWSAWAFHSEGMPAPMWQVDVHDSAGRWLARVDGWWPEGVVGEADGRAKYRLEAAERGGADAAGLAAVLDRERRREKGLRRAGAEVVRWGAADVLASTRAAELAVHLLRELRRARARHAFDGSAHEHRTRTRPSAGRARW